MTKTKSFDKATKDVQFKVAAHRANEKNAGLVARALLERGVDVQDL